MKKSQFVKSSILTDSLAVRCADFTSSGRFREFQKVTDLSEICYVIQHRYRSRPANIAHFSARAVYT